MFQVVPHKDDLQSALRKIHLNTKYADVFCIFKFNTNYIRLYLAFIALIIFMPPPLEGGGIKRCFCLKSDVCLSI